MTPGADEHAVPTRQESIITAATMVFLRFGFRKTTMDDVAREAGISRQGLYLHFKSKNAVFRSVVESMLSGMRDSVRHALERDDLSVTDRLVDACEAFHGLTVGKVELSHFSELLERASSFAGPRMREMEREFVVDIAELLARSGHAALWEKDGISARDLAEHLFDASAGAKYESTTAEAYLTRVRVAARIVARGAAPSAPVDESPSGRRGDSMATSQRARTSRLT